MHNVRDSDSVGWSIIPTGGRTMGTMGTHSHDPQHYSPDHHHHHWSDDDDQLSQFNPLLSLDHDSCFMFQVLVRSSSAQVSNETGHSALLEAVTVVLPHSWNKAGCAPVTGEVSSDQETDMMISDTQLLWTLQHGGCGH